MERGGLGFGENAPNTGGLGTKNGQPVFGVREDDIEIGEGRQKKKGAEVANIVGPLPHEFECAHEPGRGGEESFISLDTPPGEDEEHRK